MNDVIYLTQKDYDRLHLLVQSQRAAGTNVPLQGLCDDLRTAQVIPPTQVPVDVVTMNSLVRLKEKKSGRSLELTIAYPKDADVAKQRISVLSPVGSAVLGRKVGQEVACDAPLGPLTYQIEEVLYQPEAAGDYSL